MPKRNVYNYDGLTFNSIKALASYTGINENTQKPVALYEWILSKYAKHGDKILDTHVGSASSLIACHKNGFRYVGFEIDEDYFWKAKQRLDEEKAQMNIYDFPEFLPDEMISPGE